MKTFFSIIIIAYEARDILSFCLKSLKKAGDRPSIEIIIVDNSADDGLEEYLSTHFSNIRYFQNSENIGFARACNQGADLAEGENLLFLNPDTIVPANLFDELTAWINKVGEWGLATVQLLDGSGKRLPETARLLPSISAALLKIFGLDHQYYDSLEKSSTYQEIEVVSGAFVLCKKSVFESLGGFDERYFMYAEDIDLSRTSMEAGYKNYLLNTLQIIHFKGESTEKRKWNYNFHFYNSLFLYFEKHFRSASLLAWVAKCLTVLLSLLSFVKKTLLNLWRPVTDILFSVILVWAVSEVYGFFKFNSWTYYQLDNVLFNGFVYGVCWVMTMALSGAYLAPLKPRIWFKSGIIGLGISLIVYAMLPLDLRFSRAVPLLSGIVAIAFFVWRSGFRKSKKIKKEILVLSSPLEQQEHSQILKYIHPTQKYALAHPPDTIVKKADHVIIDFSDLENLFRVFNLGYNNISIWDRTEGLFLSSSNPKVKGQTHGELSHHNLAQAIYIHQKRSFDITLALLMMVPLVIIKSIQFRIFKWHTWRQLLIGRITSVGYDPKFSDQLVQLKPSLLNLNQNLDSDLMKLESCTRYSMHYSILDDISVVISRPFEFIKKINQ